MSIRCGGPDEDRDWRVFVAPSGLQKEDMIGEDVFELDMDGEIIVPPVTPNLKLSACTPLWYVVYRHRPKVKCVIHTHSMNAFLATILDPSEESEVLNVTHLEMLKGVGGHAYDDTLQVPIIDNRPSEDLLADQMEAAILKYPKSNAILVRRHGLYVWGDSWEQAKTNCESFDNIFETCIKMKSIGVDFSSKPKTGTYWEGKRPLREEIWEGDHDIKRFKKGDGTAVSGFHGVAKQENEMDLAGGIPLIPLNAKILLLDIEGCTTSISFVKDTLFPYILKHLDTYVDEELDHKQADEVFQALQNDVQNLSDPALKQECMTIPTDEKELCHRTAIKQIVRKLMSHDIKATGLKALQGNMWKAGYHSGLIRAHVYPDFVPLLEWCSSHSIQVNIYSSGSINAQKLLFANTLFGDLTSHFHDYFDTTSGSKVFSESYKVIAGKLGVDVKEILFVSDAEKELVAARDAGVGNVVMSVRPGNAPVTEVGRGFPMVFSLLQLCGA